MTYSEKLKDPRWQRRRLEVLKAAEFRCQDCGDTTKTLAVHHGRYERGKEPWEAANHDLICLCEESHQYRHSLEAEIKTGMSCLPLHLLNALSTTALVMGHVGMNMEDRFGKDLSIKVHETVMAKHASWNNVEKI
jgi:hypothetical protein